MVLNVNSFRTTGLDFFSVCWLSNKPIATINGSNSKGDNSINISTYVVEYIYIDIFVDNKIIIQLNSI